MISRLRISVFSISLFPFVLLLSNLNGKSLLDYDLEELLSIKLSVASKTELTAMQSPSTVSLFTYDEIQNLGFTKLEELMNFVPGVQTGRSDWFGYSYAPSFRGRLSHPSGREVLVLYDGIRLNDVFHGGTFLQDIGIHLGNLQQVEIIRGPGSSLYGANAYMGVINLVSSKEKRNIVLNKGTFGATNVLSNYSESGKDWNISIFASYFDDEGYKYKAFYTHLGHTEDTQDPQKGKDLTLNTNYKNLQFTFRHSNRLFKDFVQGGSLSDGVNSIELDNTSARLSYEFDPKADLNISVYGDYMVNQYDLFLAVSPPNVKDPETNSFWDDPSITIAGIGGNYKKLYQFRTGTDFTYYLNQSHLFRATLSARREWNDLVPFQGNWDADHNKQTGGIRPGPEGKTTKGFYIGETRFDLLQPEERTILAASIQDEWKYSNMTTITAGLRYDYYDDFGENLSLRGAVIKKLTKLMAIKLMYGEGFRAPSFSETRRGISSTGISNPDLKPEKIKTYEAGLIYQAEKTEFAVTFFQNEISDTILEVPTDEIVTGFSARQPQNIGKTSTNGVEIEFRYMPTKNLYFRGGGFQMINDFDSEPVAKTSLFLITNYRFKKIKLNLNCHYLGKVPSRRIESDYMGTPIDLDAYTVVNFNFQYELSKNLKLSSTISNLFDRSYRTYSPQLGIENGLPSRGRQCLLGLEYTW